MKDWKLAKNINTIEWTRYFHVTMKHYESDQDNRRMKAR